MQYFLSYIFKSNTAENFQIRQVALSDLHPFDWLKEKEKLKHIESYTILGFQNISVQEFENFPGEKTYKELDLQIDIEKLVECQQEVL